MAMRQRGMRQRGFALLVVLWSLALATFLVARLGTTARVEARLAGNLRGAASLQAQADGAIWDGTFHLLDRGRDHWRADGSVYRQVRDGLTIHVRMTDEAAKFNLDRASAPMLAALSVSLGGPASIGTEIVGWRTDGTLAENAASDAAQAGTGYRPPHAPFRSVAELRLLHGMTQALFDRVAPHVSLFSTYGPGPDTTDPVVARVLAGLGAAQESAGYEPVDTITIDAVVDDGHGNSASRHAVIRLEPTTGADARVMEWQ